MILKMTRILENKSVGLWPYAIAVFVIVAVFTTISIARSLNRQSKDIQDIESTLPILYALIDNITDFRVYLINEDLKAHYYSEEVKALEQYLIEVINKELHALHIKGEKQHNLINQLQDEWTLTTQLYD